MPDPGQLDEDGLAKRIESERVTNTADRPRHTRDPCPQVTHVSQLLLHEGDFLDHRA
ncbi:hypothetical protein [Streptomyces sp. NPDC058206]|uniref:hypothetical protein n=1 Tax=Streptomyces sp. NPDC058206 TaxID=3346382 RepID=UPI0036EBA6C9